ncbi:hypothetical protein ACYEXS_19765 [Paenibacillus sp. MAH-36]|uniref:Histidine kinase/HSP90-like ATPase domain-containing protein n=1 Tax=Paenibacillus violae TaxID=3077234 RepID=A0ABU3R7E5_9BACL|nr:hypothetical protein [Paenibacillus sp. PFR10]MDU0200181.1 hypothetical protein [Paenibacillus sp. PFR10]
MQIYIPQELNVATSVEFYKETLDRIKIKEPEIVVFRFEKLKFIEPAGMVTLTNLIELIDAEYPEISIRYTFPDGYKTDPFNRAFKAIDFLDDCLFFEKVMGEKIHPGSNERRTTNGLEKLNAKSFNQQYIDHTIQWLKLNVGLKTKSFSFLGTALSEIFNNIIDHSGSPNGGCAFAQHYPSKNQINLCIADSGMGIATRMKTRFTVDHQGNDLVSDADFINFATHKKVSTKTTPKNRGMGLNTLLHIIDNNKGSLQILSNEGSLRYNNGKKRLRDIDGYYKGTLIQISFRTDTLEEEEEEELLW